MMAFWLEQGEYLLRILLAMGCGFLLRFGRQRSPVVAGGWSLAMIAASASLLMIVSKYGFFDLLPQEGIGLDPSRVAAGLMTAIGFLGSLIFVHKQTVVGLPTAVVIWATVGVGMSIGLFFLLPTLLGTAVTLFTHSMLVRNVAESLLKIVIFVGYLVLCSRMKDIHRVFQYHGAEQIGRASCRERV